jgi:hypothetical protein
MREGAPGANDCFRPPEIPIEVFCAHCQQEYDSYLIHWVEDSSFANGGYWACPTPDCDGKGFTFDIWPTDPDWTDEHGNKVCFLDDEDAVEDDWEGDLAEVADDDTDDDVWEAHEEESIDVIEDPDRGLLIPETSDSAEADLDDEDYAPLELDDELNWEKSDEGWDIPRRTRRIPDSLEFHPDDDLPF